MVVEELKRAISEALKILGVEVPKVELEHPAELSHGDFSTNVALVYAKELKMKPRELAEKITAVLKGSTFFPIQGRTLEKIEVAGAGFINFYLTKEFFSESIAEALRQAQGYGKNGILANKKVMVEYTDPNPFKEFHIGHLMSNAIGESVARVFEYNGANVLRACWQGDVGLHVAKAIWGMQKKIQDTGYTIQEEVGTKEWGKAYAEGSEAYETDATAKKEINELNKKIFERTDKTVNELYDQGREVSLAHFEEIYKQLGTKFVHYFFEGKEGILGKPIVEENLGKGIFEKSDGAVVFKGEPYGLHTRVFINSLGLPTYEAKELGLNKRKFELEPDLYKSVIITGNEINEYFKVLLKVMSLIMPKVAEKTVHLPHGMLRMTTGKMSSRKGNVITGEGLIEQVKELVMEKVKDREMSGAEKETLAEVVAIGAIKYSILRQAIGGDIIFDFEKSISFEGDSGPYLQYSSVRARSVLQKAKEVCNKPPVDIRCPQNWETTTLEKLLVRFPEVVERAGEEYQPHYITTYLTELAGVFNSWYAGGKIVDADDPASPYKLALTEAFARVMQNGLWLLGIAVPERM